MKSTKASLGFESLLKVIDLSVSFVQYQKGLRQSVLKVISNLDISLGSGEILAVVGSSGSGKSLLAHAILGILPNNAFCSGKILYKDELLTPERQKKIRGSEITLVPQSVNFLDPLMRVSAQVRTAVRQGNAEEAQKKIFSRYDLSEGDGNLFPFQLSGGMARRVLISAAVVNGSKLIIADEPTPGLHPEIVAETLKHLRELADEGCGVMLITHDISTALQVADKIAVFYAGTTVETAFAADFHGQGQTLRHPYTKALWQSLPQNDFRPLPGFQPLPANLSEGCSFAPRCGKMTPKCTGSLPVMRDLRNGRVRCYHAT
ncbi:ABC transporter ATP-binding protein [Desulfosporosinus meridiei]|uniref:Nickel import system ATP-binding protein NikD n=1 Tax=Desulfosporosinus meridiei (strain ATCC BAA-275 / DSM 13257 / KCTC 12902 / NCIMB 13706 / S10) TaxID=768704 RepID=J7IV58_DESMD|nr:ABC transporter ATP-binding protein [Desulfosporosinus meridiei]AFQ42591.1 oligopeptide/dipeptide ABC transporter, ATP-binding protein [Desulfosporosinus meridiei DSM 13257]